MARSRSRWPFPIRLALLVALAAVVYFGVRALVALYYPLDYRELIFRRAGENGLDPYLVAALIRRESRFRPDATSASGARGLMQIMPETGEWVARQMGLEDFSPQKLYEPDYNIRLGCWYLASLHREFAGDTVVALAAYNGGRNNVRKWLDERQWTGEPHTLQQIPFQETRNYVSRVLLDYKRYRSIYTTTP